MDPFTLCLLLAAVAMRLPSALSDAYTARKAADAGEWDFLKDRAARKDARAARRADWAERILARRRAKAEGLDPKRAGLGTLLADIYHGACEDALERRTARRAARPPVAAGKGHRRSRWDQVTDLLRGMVKRARDARRPTDRVVEEPEPVSADRPAGSTSRPAADHPGRADRAPRGCVWVSGSSLCRAPVPDDEEYCRPHLDEWADMIRRATDANRHPDPIKPQFVDDPTPTDTDPTVEGDPMTAPTGTAGAATVGDVQTNEDARRALEQMREGAIELGEAAAMAEAAKAKIQAASQATGDAMSAKSFDAGATDAVNNINDIVSNDNLSAMSAAADEIESAASKGLKDLEKYRDSEDLVAAEKVDATTLASTSS